MGRITLIFTAASEKCSFCTEAKKLLQENDITFDEVPLASTSELPHRLYPWTDVHNQKYTFPQIIWEGMTFLGGLDKLRDKLDEPILKDQLSRFTMFPVRYHDLFEKYKVAQSALWTAEEVDYSAGKNQTDWNKVLSDDEREFVKMILAFFAGADGIVNENLDVNFSNEVQLSEARSFYTVQMYAETVHSETYSLLLETYVKDADEQRRLFDAIETIPVISSKAQWALKYMSPSKPFAQRLVAFVCVEGLLFSSSFASIYWLKSRNLLPALCVANNFIAADEGQHQQFGELLYSHLKYKLSHDLVEQIISEAVNVEVEFTREAVPCQMIGLNADLMEEYIKFVADRILVALGNPKKYNTRNPFPFMENLAIRGKGNFFEVQNSEYQKAGVTANKDHMRFALVEDF